MKTLFKPPLKYNNKHELTVAIADFLQAHNNGQRQRYNGRHESFTGHHGYHAHLDWNHCTGQQQGGEEHHVAVLVLLTTACVRG